MRLTLVIAAMGAGGAERVASILVNAWADRGVTVTLLTFDDGATPPFYALDRNVRHRTLGISGDSNGWCAALGNNVQRVRKLRAAIASSAPDVILCLLTETSVLTLIATFGMKVPVIACEHTDPFQFPVGRVWDVLRRVSYPWAARVVVLNERARKYFRFGVRTVTIPNPVLASNPTATTESLRHSRTIAAMGRLAPEKRFDLLLGAFAQIADRCPGWSLEIIGDGPQRGALESLRERLGLGARVRMPGNVQDAPAALARAALFVSSSAIEGFPMAITEAMACGLPVVAAEYHEGIHEIMRDGHDGIVVPGDAGGLAAAIERLIHDPDERVRLGTAARGIVDRYGLKQAMARWTALFEEVKFRG